MLREAKARGQSNQASASQQDPIADAARRAERAEKAIRPRRRRFSTNDDLPAVGQTAPAASTSPASNGNPNWNLLLWLRQLRATSKCGAISSCATESQARDQDQAELDVLQRELSVLNTQYYGGDPMKGLQQGLSQQDITAKKDKIDRQEERCWLTTSRPSRTQNRTCKKPVAILEAGRARSRWRMS